jgi:hypothetical protein
VGVMATAEDNDDQVARLRHNINAVRELVTASDKAHDAVEAEKTLLLAQVLSLLQPVLPGLSSKLDGHLQHRGVYLTGGPNLLLSLVLGEEFVDGQPVLWQADLTPHSKAHSKVRKLERCMAYKSLADVSEDWVVDKIIDNVNDLLERELRGNREKRTAKDVALAARLQALATVLDGVQRLLKS